jgi:4-amino-4-deoxychorismate lyase
MLWIDGSPAATTAPLDRGLEFGDGLFETIAVVAGRPRLLSRHLDRLAHGCAVLGFACPSRALLEAEIQAAAREPGVAVIKLVLTRGDGGIGYTVDDSRSVRRYLVASPARRLPLGDTARVAVLPTHIARSARLAGLKHLNRLEQVLLRRDVMCLGLDEGLVTDDDNRLISGVMSNVFLVRGGSVVTPALDQCGIAGVMRAAIIDTLGAAGVPCQVREVAPQELQEADEVFLTNALIGVWPVTGIGEQTLSVGDVATMLMTEVSRW